MFNFYSPAEVAIPSRRRFLQEAGLGFGSLALASLLHGDARGDASTSDHSR